MHCPIEGCGGQLGTREVRQKDSTVRRRRFCRSCGHRFTTYESIAEGPDRALGEKELARALVALVHKAPPEAISQWLDLPPERIKALRRQLVQARKDCALQLPFLELSPSD